MNQFLKHGSLEKIKKANLLNDKSPAEAGLKNHEAEAFTVGAFQSTQRKRIRRSADDPDTIAACGSQKSHHGMCKAL